MADAQLVALTRQWAMLTASGINIVKSLELLHSQADDPKLKDSLGQVVTRVSGGQRLTQALAAFPHTFPPLFLAMTRLGEQSGGIVAAFSRLADWLEQDQKVYLRWRGAMVYPAIVLCVSAVLVFLLFSFVLPAFVGVFQSFQMPLPGITRLLLWLSVQTRNPVAWLVAAFFCLEGYRQIRLQWRLQRLYWSQRIVRTPGLGPLYRAATLGRMCLALECTVSVGIPILQAWTLAASVSGCALLDDDAPRVVRCCKDGETLTEALEVNPLYPSDLREMVRAGEESGRLSDLLASLGKIYDLEVDHRVAVFTALLEPVLLSGLALLVAGLVLALLLPLYSLVNQMAG